MVRRTKLAAEETREQILDAAEQCFRDIGVARTTLQMVAERAGCTRGAIYWHFREKNDLLRQVIERVPLLLFNELEAQLQASRPVAAVRHCLLRSLDDFQSDRHLRNVIEVIFFRDECPEEISSELSLGKDGVEKLLQLLLYTFKSGKARGEIKADIPAETLACLIFFIFSGALRTCTLMPESSWIVREGKTVMNWVFDTANNDKETYDECL
ncbi:TetR family transcriptional regulator [Pectobacterium actinidiae]|uniref:TetR family transcriptional regulator n=1 Tax=Pectobacterium actinidiae TaxID=1507808 RepID=UPI002A814D2F|nr:TetR family transcriptional regulator [Pectobacterium actinidiae]MDY4316505.1 TetR family transcriptional regulator [Pectobacterium actinidiae]